MSLPRFIESLVMAQYPNDDEPMGLVDQFGVEYLYPIVPPNTTTYFVTNAVGMQVMPGGTGGVPPTPQPIYGNIFYRISFGYIVPNAFRLTVMHRGTTSYYGTLSGYHIEHGIDTFLILAPNRNIVTYITNLTDANQRFQMINEGLIIPDVDRWELIKKYLIKFNFPYSLPDIEGGA